MSRLAACTNKHAHLTWHSAEREAKRLRRKIGKPVRHYACPYCGKRHVGEWPK